MNQLQIQYFLTVAQCLNFSRAAEIHYTSQPSISRQIALLEKELGFRLFLRNKHSVQLTPSGAILSEAFRALRDQAAEALEQARRASAEGGGRLNFGYLQETNIEILLPFIKRFTRAYPKVEVTFEGYGFKDLKEKLVDGTLDVAFVLSFELPNVPCVEQRVVLPTTAHIVISVSHPLAGRENLSLLDFKDEWFIVAAETGEGADFVLGQCLNAGFRPREVIKSATSESIIMYVESRSGVAVMDESNRFYRDPKFRFIRIEGERAKISVNAAWRRDNANPAVALFGEVLAGGPPGAIPP